MQVEEYFKSLYNLINATLFDYLAINDTDYQTVADAMQYSVEIGGKRIRPILALEFCKMCGGNISDALPFACALEMIHTYSLVHDDLPAMDNDDYRRGKESCHKKFGEANAILAGDALLTYAFQIASDAGVSDHTIVKCTRALSNYAGIYGMVGGQTLDLENEESTDITVERLEETDKLKTGALIRCACELGCNAAMANNEQFEAAKVYAENLGLAFQIIDDILDVTGDTETLGKEVGSDAQNGKATYVTLLGLDGAKARAEELTNNALKALEVFDNNENLIYFTKQLLARNK
ncbi:MAG: polyprenyl synthetase family protein [Clostridia bacterium]|nr:polyprenyl synthetase family protein [Clostridia bacterium]